jgi:hypothetical protein
MTEQRTRSSTVKFDHPFRITDVDGELPPGQYEVETTEEPIDGLSFVAYRRLWTTISLPAMGASQGAHRATSKQIVMVDPKELETALSNDGKGPVGGVTK